MQVYQKQDMPVDVYSSRVAYAALTVLEVGILVLGKLRLICSSLIAV